MRRAVVACIAAVVVLPAIFGPVQALRRDVSVAGTVARVDRGKFPEVKVTLVISSSSPSGLKGRTIAARPLYVQDKVKGVLLKHPVNRQRLAAYYLTRGDRVSAKLYVETQSDRTQRAYFGKQTVYWITAIARTAPAHKPSLSGASKGMELKTNLNEYPVGRAVQMEFVVTNSTDTPMQFGFSSGQQYDFWVKRGETEVWRWSRGKYFTQALTRLNVAPGQSKTFSALWDQKDDHGNPVAVGTYVVAAQLTTSGERPPVVSKTINIALKSSSQTSVSDILARPGQYLEKTVRVSGVYYGWRAPENVPGCDAGPPVTRSDWMISDGKACIYVTGLSELDPENDRGKNVSVLAQVKKSEKGQVYLRAEEVRAE